MEKKRVVVIGGHWETQMMATCALEGAGYDTITLFDRRAALRAVLDTRPDLVLLDMALPKLKAWQIIRSLRQDRRTQDVPIIGIVPDEERTEAAALARTGLAHVFARPIDNRSLIRKVRRVLRDDREQKPEY
ncbi:MAG: response regulator [Chloroflexota bacterium]|nr:response regulator [Chloroflexota bacterium]